MKTSIKPKPATKKLLRGLQDRARYVIEKRFGLDDEQKMTLEAIGQEHNITRERVRQIENFALNSIRKSDSFDEIRAILEELETIVDDLGGIVSEEDDIVIQNHIHFYLVLGDSFTKHSENKHFKERWSVNDDIAVRIHEALESLYSELNVEDIVAEERMIQSLMEQLKDVNEKYQRDGVIKRWLRLSKRIAQNPLGEYGRVESQNVKTRGVKDYAYLIMRKHGSPMHFAEVAEAITQTFGRKTHTATCHNELIKDPRFVLVGRGVYALRDWGYKSGVVREVIQDILEKEGPLSRDEIIEKVLKERYLKRNTILVNLQNARYFTKDLNGLYRLI